MKHLNVTSYIWPAAGGSSRLDSVMAYEKVFPRLGRIIQSTLTPVKALSVFWNSLPSRLDH